MRRNGGTNFIVYRDAVWHERVTAKVKQQPDMAHREVTLPIIELKLSPSFLRN